MNTTKTTTARNIQTGQTVLHYGTPYTIIENRLGACGDRFLVYNAEGDGMAFRDSTQLTVVA